MPLREWKTYTTLDQLDNLEVLKARFHNQVYGRHFHEGYALGVILSGSETYDCSGKSHVAPRGSVVVVNPGEIHDGQALDSQEGWAYFMIYPKPSLVRKALAQMEMENQRLPVFPESVIQDQALARRLIRFMARFEGRDPGLGLESGFLEIFSLLVRRHGRLSRPLDSLKALPDPRVARAMDLIHAEFDTPLTLDRLSEAVGISAFALLRRFKKQTGISPYLLQTRLRLDKAKQALRQGLSPAQTAALCGYADQSHMTKQFRRWMGITPGDICPARI